MPHLLIRLAIAILLVQTFSITIAEVVLGLDLFLISLSQLEDYKSIKKCYCKRAVSTAFFSIVLIYSQLILRNWCVCYVLIGYFNTSISNKYLICHIKKLLYVLLVFQMVNFLVSKIFFSDKCYQN
jgi:hypothetical protein